MVRNLNLVLARISYLQRVNMYFHVEKTIIIRKHFFSYVNFTCFVPCIMKLLLTMIHWLVPWNIYAFMYFLFLKKNTHLNLHKNQELIFIKKMVAPIYLTEILPRGKLSIICKKKVPKGLKGNIAYISWPKLGFIERWNPTLLFLEW